MAPTGQTPPDPTLTLNRHPGQGLGKINPIQRKQLKGED